MLIVPRLRNSGAEIREEQRLIKTPSLQKLLVQGGHDNKARGMLCVRQGECYKDKAKRRWTEEVPGAANGWAGSSRTHMVFGQILCVLGEVVALGKCKQRANSMSKDLKVGRGTVFAKVQEWEWGAEAVAGDPGGPRGGILWGLGMMQSARISQNRFPGN